MADLARIKNNVAKMAAQNAPEEDIDGYIASEGVTVEDVRNFNAAPAPQQAPQEPVRSAVPSLGGAAFGAATEGSHAGLMGGFDDEITAGMLAPVDAAIDWFKGDGFDMGKAYTRKQQMLDAQKQTRRQEHPIASIAGEVAGGLATGAGASKAGLSLFNRSIPVVTKYAPKTAAVITGAGEGAVYGGIYGAGEAKPGERIEGAKKGATVGALTGGAISGAGAVIAGRASQKAANAAAPMADDLAATSRGFYKAAENEGVRYRAPVVNRLRQNLKIAAGRPNDRLRPKTAGFLDDIDDMFNGDLSLEAFDEFRKSLNLEMRRATPDDRRTLESMKHMADAWADRVQNNPIAFTGDAKKATDLLKQGRSLWGQHKKASVIERIMDQADVDGAGKYTQSGFANAVRREMNTLYKSIMKGKERGWTKEEIALIRQMAKGGSNSQVVNLMAKFSPRGPMSIMLGQLAGMGIPGVGNVAVPLAGHLAGRAADRGALTAAQTLRNAAAMGVSPSQAAITQLPNRLAPLIPATASASMGTGRSLAR